MAEVPRPRNLQATLAAKLQKASRSSSNGGFGTAPSRTSFFSWPGRMALLIAIVVSPWAFGGAYHSAQFFIAITILIGLVSMWLDSAFALRKLDRVPFMALLLLSGLIIGWVQLIPLADSTALSLAGKQHSLYSAAAATIGQGSTPQFSISIDREATWDQVRLLTMALGALLLGCGLFQRKSDLILLLITSTANGVALAFFGLIQKLSWNGRIYWTVELVNGGQPFGPFINRNNASGYLLICLAAALGLLIYLWTMNRQDGPEEIISREIPIWRQWQHYLTLLLADLTATKLAALFAVIAIAIGVVATISRGGVVALLAGTITTLVFYGMARRPKSGGLLLLPLLGSVLLLSCWIGFYDDLTNRFQESSIDSIATGEEIDHRLQTWKQSLRSRADTGAIGAGLGAFPAINRMYGEVRETAISEYAENQFVQGFVDAGIPGLLLLVIAVALASWSAVYLIYVGSSSSTICVGVMALFLVSSQVTAGCFDFGWYVPANMLFGSVLIGIVSQQTNSLASRIKKPSLLRFALPGWFGRLLLLAVFAICIVVTSDLYQESVFESVRGPDPQRSDFRSLDLAQTDQQIKSLTGPSIGKVSTRRLNQVGMLLVHRARLKYFKTLCESAPISTLNAQQRTKVEDNIWQLTNLVRMQEQAQFAFETGGFAALENFRRQAFIGNDLRQAYDFFAASWVRRPPQPEIVARLGQIQSLLGNEKRAAEFMEQSTILAPTNVRLHLNAGLTSLFYGNTAKAIPHFKQILELDPNEFAKTISLVRGFTGRVSNSLDNTTIARQIIPDNPEMIYNFAFKHLDADDPLRKELLDKAELLLGDVSPTNTKGILLKANVLLANQDFERGLEFLKSAVISQPFNQANRFRLAELLVEQNDLDEARNHADELILVNAKYGPYIALLKKIKELQTKRKMTPNSN